MFEPNSIIKLLRNVNITGDYTHTFHFSSISEQATFFLAKTHVTFDNFSYQRATKNIRVPVNVETLWDVSYLMFQNSNFGTRWFYAFIKNIVYINDNLTEIEFEIDVIQSFMFDLSWKQCFIEREHVSSDSIGEHTVDEGLNVGDIVVNSTYNNSELTENAIVMAVTEFPDGGFDDFHAYDGVNYSGLMFLIYYSVNGTDAGVFVQEKINEYNTAGKSAAIKFIFQFPRAFIGSDGFIQTVSDIATRNTFIDGYDPKNNKLFCYPYNYLEVSNNHGQNKIYKWELTKSEFNGNPAISFVMHCNMSPSPSVTLIPWNYNVSNNPNRNDVLILQNYPLCAWNSDVFSNWLAQNQVSNAVNIGGSILSLAGGIATGQPLAIAGGILGVANSIGAFYEKSIEPNVMHGSASGSGNLAAGTQNFTFYKKSVKYENAKIIDDFFSRYGYKVNSFKTPSFHTRASWNYVKMNECNVVGNIPNMFLAKIKELHLKGITYWHSDNVGDFSLNNHII